MWIPHEPPHPHLPEVRSHVVSPKSSTAGALSEVPVTVLEHREEEGRERYSRPGTAGKQGREKAGPGHREAEEENRGLKMVEHQRQDQEAEVTPGELFSIVAVGTSFAGEKGRFERTGEREFAMVEGEWSAWVEALESELRRSGMRLIDRRPVTDEMGAVLRAEGVEVCVSRNT